MRDIGRLVGCILTALVSVALTSAQAEDDIWADILSETQETAPEEENEYEFTARLQFWGGIDTVDDTRYEDLYEARGRIALEAGYRRGEWFRARIAGAAIADVQARSRESGRIGHEFLLEEATVTFRSGRVDVRFGQAVIPWGRADFLNPTDVLNPPNIRRFVTAEFDLTRVPLFFAQTSVYFGDFAAEFFVLPFQEPMEVSLLGTDWASLDVPLETQLALGGLAPVEGSIGQLLWDVDPEILRRLEDSILRSGIQDDDLGESSYAARLTGNFGPTAMSLSYFYGWDYLPETALGTSIEDLTADREITVTELLTLLPEVLSGTSSYHRTHMIGFDFESIVGGSTVRGEVAYYSDRTQYLDDFDAVVEPWIWWIAGIDRNFGSNYLNLQVSGAHILDDTRRNYSNFKRDQFIVTLLYQGQFLRDRLHPELRVIGSPNSEDFLINPRISYDLLDTLQLGVGALVLEGEPSTLIGQYDNNDQVFLFMEWVL